MEWLKLFYIVILPKIACSDALKNGLVKDISLEILDFNIFRIFEQRRPQEMRIINLNLKLINPHAFEELNHYYCDSDCISKACNDPQRSNFYTDYCPYSTRIDNLVESSEDWKSIKNKIRNAIEFERDSLTEKYKEAIEFFFLLNEDTGSDLRANYSEACKISFLKIERQQFEKIKQEWLYFYDFYDKSNRFIDIIYVLYNIFEREKYQEFHNTERFYYYYRMTKRFLKFCSDFFEIDEIKVDENCETNLKKFFEKLMNVCKDHYLNFENLETIEQVKDFYLVNTKQIFDLYIIFGSFYKKLGAGYKVVCGRWEWIAFAFDNKKRHIAFINYNDYLSIRDYKPVRNEILYENSRKIEFDMLHIAWFDYMHRLYTLNIDSDAESREQKIEKFIDKIFEYRNYSFVRPLLVFYLNNE